MAEVTLHFSFFGSVNQFFNDCAFLQLIFIELINQTSLIPIKCGTVYKWFVASSKMCLLIKLQDSQSLKE